MPADTFIDDDEEKKAELAEGNKRIVRDFDCPSCNANNPLETAIRDGAEVVCNYCGCEFKARVSEEGRIRLREL